jgi:hypothetical protein
VHVDPVKELQMTVPVATPPSQVPEIKSAGIAPTTYSHSDDYSSTADRQRVLWIELADTLAYKRTVTEDLYGICAWSNDETSAILESMGLPDDSPLSVLAAGDLLLLMP